jgi:hypothetical protein
MAVILAVRSLPVLPIQKNRETNSMDFFGFRKLYMNILLCWHMSMFF